MGKNGQKIPRLWIPIGWVVLLAVELWRPSVAEEDPRIPQNAAIVLRRNAGGTMAGAKTPDVIVIEFFDYNCPYCKNFVPAMQAVLHDDARVAVVYKDWPILGENSVYAARAALAAEWQGRYLIAHDALLSGPRLSSPAQVDAVLEKQGIDMVKLKADRDLHSAEIDARLARIDAQASALGIRGTPSVLVGRLPLAGNVDAAQLQEAIAAARRAP